MSDSLIWKLFVPLLPQVYIKETWKQRCLWLLYCLWERGGIQAEQSHHWNSHAGAFLSDRAQSGFCNWRPFTREGFCLRSDANGSFYSTQTGCSGFHLPGGAGVISMGTVRLAVCVYVFVTINHLLVSSSVSLLTMMASRIFWKSFLKPSVELQNRAKFPSRSCRMRQRGHSVYCLNTQTHAHMHMGPRKLWLGAQTCERLNRLKLVTEKGKRLMESYPVQKFIKTKI